MAKFNMKLCVSSYSFGNLIDDDKLGYLGVMDKAKEMGFSAIEYVDDDYMKKEGFAKNIREHAEEIGMKIACFSVGGQLLGSMPDENVEYLCKMVDYAAEMGAPLMRHDVGGAFKGTYDQALELLAPRIRKVTEYAESKGVKTMVENHGNLVQGGERVAKLIEAVNHPNMGALMDVGNFMCNDLDPVVETSILAPFAFHVHVKDFLWKSGMDVGVTSDGGWFRTIAQNWLRGTVIGHGEAKIAQSIEVLKHWWYDGYVTIEFEGLENNIEGIKIGAKNLKKYLGEWLAE